VPPARRTTTRKAAAKRTTPPAERFPWDADSFPDQAAVEVALAALKAAVVAEVNRLTDRHGWCDAAQRSLLALRLVKPPKPVTVTMEVEVTADALRSLGMDTSTDDAVRRAIKQNPGRVATYGTVKSTQITETPPRVRKAAAAPQ